MTARIISGTEIAQTIREELKIEIETDQELLADQALNMYVKNETVEIKDEYDQTWYPVFKVSFKKSN